jgi:hypothetical protein
VREGKDEEKKGGKRRGKVKKKNVGIDGEENNK